MRKAGKCLVDFAQEPANAMQKFWRLRAGIGKNRSFHKCQEPNKTSGTIRRGDGSKQTAVLSGHDAGKTAVRQMFSEMLQSPCLHVDKGLLAGGMHDLEDESPTIATDEMEIVVVLARQKFGRRFEAVKIAGEAHRLSFGGWVCYAVLEKHASIL